MNTSIALFNGLSRAAGRTIVTGTLSPSRALAIGLRRPFSNILGVLPGLSKSSCTVSSSTYINRPCLCVGGPSRLLTGLETTFSHLQLLQDPATAGTGNKVDREHHEDCEGISGSANPAGGSPPVCICTAH